MNPLSAAVLCLIVGVALVGATNSLPEGYRIKPKSEAVFQFVFETLEVDTGNKTLECRYDAVVRPGKKSKQLLVVFEDVDLKAHAEEAAEDEFTAMELPILVSVDDDGVWSKIQISPNETDFSLLLKNILLEHLTFNSSELQDHAKSTQVETLNDVMDGTPLGNCKMDINVVNSPQHVDVYFNSSLEHCEGDTDFSIGDSDVPSLNSTINLRLSFCKNPLQYKRSELNVNYTLTTSESHVFYHQSLEFVTFRPAEAPVDVSELTETYDPVTFAEKLQANGPFAIDHL